MRADSSAGVAWNPGRNTTKASGTAPHVGSAVPVTPASATADLARMARDLGDAARSAGIHRLAVSRFEPMRGAEDGRGALLSERLTVALVRGGRVETVERNLLAKIADEISLDRTGALEGGAHRAVRLAPVDGIVVGRYSLEGRTLRVYARLVRLDSGLIAGAAEAQEEDERGGLAADPFDVPVPALTGDFPAFEDLKDAPAEQSACVGAAERVDRMQTNILELKARYWAFRLRLGLDGADVKVNPGTTIPDSGLRARFYSRVSALRAEPNPVPMTEDELSEMKRLEGESYALVRDCGL